MTANSQKPDDIVAYRLSQVEIAMRDLTQKFDKQDNIKKSDLKDFQETIVTRFLDMRMEQQKQIDSLVANKAEKQELADFKKVFYAVASFLSTILAAIVIAYFAARK